MEFVNKHDILDLHIRHQKTIHCRMHQSPREEGNGIEMNSFFDDKSKFTEELSSLSELSLSSLESRAFG